MTADVACLFADAEDQQQRQAMKDDWLSQRPADLVLTVMRGRANAHPLMVEHVLVFLALFFAHVSRRRTTYASSCGKKIISGTYISFLFSNNFCPNTCKLSVKTRP